MSLGKSSSMSAVLLLVAVVVGTFASGAHAKFNITNRCSETVVIKTANGSSTLAPNEVLNVTMSPKLFFSPPVTFTTTITPNVTGTLSRKALDRLNGLGESMLKISITCELKPKCITVLGLYEKPSIYGRLMLIFLGRFCL